MRNSYGNKNFKAVYSLLELCRKLGLYPGVWAGDTYRPANNRAPEYRAFYARYM